MKLGVSYNERASGEGERTRVRSKEWAIEGNSECVSMSRSKSAVNVGSRGHTGHGGHGSHGGPAATTVKAVRRPRLFGPRAPSSSPP